MGAVSQPPGGWLISCVASRLKPCPPDVLPIRRDFAAQPVLAKVEIHGEQHQTTFARVELSQSGRSHFHEQQDEHNYCFGGNRLGCI